MGVSPPSGVSGGNGGGAKLGIVVTIRDQAALLFQDRLRWGSCGDIRYSLVPLLLLLFLFLVLPMVASTVSKEDEPVLIAVSSSVKDVSAEVDAR